MERKRILLEVSHGDWNDWACSFYRLHGVRDSLQDLTGCDDYPYWMDESMTILENLLISFIITQNFPGVDHHDLDDDGYITEIMYDTYLEIKKQHTTSPLLINDGILREFFVPKLYENIQKAIETLIAEAMEQMIDDE